MLEQERRAVAAELARNVARFRAEHQAKESRREFDLSDPSGARDARPARLGDDDPRTGASGAQKFDGEDLDAGARRVAQTAQAAAWYAAQTAEKRARLEEARLAKAAHADLLRAQVGATTCCPGTGNYSYAQPPFQDPNFDWYHAVMVMDRGAGTNTLYIDGVVADSQPIPDDGSSMQGALHIGSNFEGTNGFDGTLDEMRISTRGLPADWIVLQHAVMTGAVVSVMEPEAF